jgi:hypothetical protein
MKEEKERWLDAGVSRFDDPRLVCGEEKVTYGGWLDRKPPTYYYFGRPSGRLII